MNKLIVESNNDKFFFEAFVQHLNNQNLSIDLKVDMPICTIDDYDCMFGSDEKKMTTKLEDALDDVRKKGLSKLGVLIDLDKHTEIERLNFVDKCLKSAVFNKFDNVLSESITSINTFFNIEIDDDTKFQVACHFTNVEGQGELETVLKNIKTQNSEYADCLQAWRDCLLAQDKKITDKEYDKFWLNNYIRFDTCTKKEQKQSEKNCSMHNFSQIMISKSHIFNLNHHILADLKSFLLLFN